MRPRLARSAGILGLLLWAAAASAAETSLAFAPAEEAGVYRFDTGTVKGTFLAEKNPEGIASLIHIPSGKELSHSPGLLSLYRLLSANTRWPNDFRDRARTARLDGGALELHWPAVEDHPAEVTAQFEWKAPEILDTVIEMTAALDLRDAELFLASYIDPSLRGYVYADTTFMEPGHPAFLPGDVRGPDDLLCGTYLAFPRNQSAAQLIYDGRWERGLHPVHFSVTRFYKQPMLLKKNAQGLCVLTMARPEDCFSLEMSYNMTPPDGIAGHSSIYLSLFGRDLAAGQTVRATVRTVVGQDIDEATALAYFKEFMDSTSF